MERKELEKILSNTLVPIGFKKKGNHWIINDNVIIKMVNLQKSEFSNSFYINYGYSLKSIPLDNTMMHIFKGLGSANQNENIRIKELLDLDSEISNSNREKELTKLLLDKVVLNMNNVNTEEDLLNELKNRPHLNDISLLVKRHFGLS